MKIFLFIFVLALVFHSNYAEAQTKDNTQKEQIVEFGFDEDPMPEGGYDAYNSYLKKNIKYPVAALKDSVQGTVYILITIDANGKLTEAKITKDPVGHGCGEEALRVIKAMDLKWTPGKMGGHPVKSRINIPVKFMLK